MSDLISRQAVDDAIYDYSRACDVDYAQIMEYIDKLPSAQPEPCGDVPDNNVGDMISRQAAIDALAEWHDVAITNRLNNLPPAQPSVSKTEIVGDVISRKAAIDALCDEYCGGWQDCKHYPKCENLKAIQNLPSAQPEWNNHEVACLLAELFDDDCACNFNGIDEWLPLKCDFAETCCPHPVGVACWEQFLKHRAERRTDG